jgi:hypothetical protein
MMLIFVCVCKWVIYKYQENHLENLNPKSALKLYDKALFWEDMELLERLTHPELLKRKGIAKITPLYYHILSLILGATDKIVYEKIADANTVEIGKVSYSLFYPTDKVRTGLIVLDEDEGVWKYNGYKGNMGNTEERLRKNPSDASLYYIYSEEIINERFPAYRFRKKYYELDPDGYWVTESFLEKLKTDEENYITNYEGYERQFQAELRGYHGRQILAKALGYIDLSRIFMFHEDYGKAEKYLNKAEDVFKGHKNERKYMKKDFDRAWQEFKQRKNGEYVDFLEELDRLREKSSYKKDVTVTQW